MANNQIPFAPQSDVGNDIPFLTDVPGVATTAPLSPDIVETRASKYDFALGDKSPGVGALMDRIQSNLEQSDREKYAIEKQVELSQVKTNMIDEINKVAAIEGRQLVPAEVQTILGLSRSDIDTMRQDPNTFFEREFAKKVIATAASMGEDGPIMGAIAQVGDAAHGRLDMFENFLTAKESYQKLAEETSAAVKGQSWPGYLTDFSKGFVPFYTWAKMKNILTKEAGGSFLPGNNLADQVEAAYNGNIEDNLPKVKQTIAALQKDNPQLASIFAHALVSYSNASRNIDNVLIPVADVVSVLFPPAMVAKGAIKGAAASVKAFTPELTRMNTLLKDIAQAVARPGVRTEEVIDAAGEVKAASSMAVERKIQDMVQSGGNTKESWDSLAGEIPGFMNPAEVLASGPRSFHSTTFINRMLNDLQSFRDDALSALLVDPLKTERFGPEAVKKAVEQAATRFRTESRPIENSIMDIKTAPIEEGLGDSKILVKIGNDEALPFDEMRTAELTAGIYGIDKYQIIPEGAGWAIQVERPLDFSTPFVRQAMRIDAKNGATPLSNSIGQLLTQWRSGEETLPRVLLEKMKKASYGMSKMDTLIRDMSKNIGYIKNNKEFSAFLKSQQMAVNPANPDKMGKFSKTLGEFEIEWAGKFNRLPTEKETKAYFSYTMLNDLEYAGLNLGLYLDKVSAGLSDLSIAGVPGKIEGKIVTKDAWLSHVGDEDANIMVLNRDGSFRVVNTKFNIKNEQGVKALDEINNLIDKEGYIPTQLSPTGRSQLQTALASVADPHLLKSRGLTADFVITPSVKADPLNLRQLPYQPGGHHIYPDGFFISQAQLVNLKGIRTKYYGDTNLYYVGNEKIAKDVAGKFDQARKLYNTAIAAAKNDPKDPAWGAFASYVKQNLPVRPSQLMKDFRKGVLDPDVPVMSRSSNQALDSAHKLDQVYPGSRFLKEKDSFFNLYRGRVNLQFAQEREGPIMEVINKGTPNNPLYGKKFADVIDPLDAMNRSLNVLTRGRNLEPLKLEMAERFLAEFGDLLKSPSLDQGRDPFTALRAGDFIEAASGDQLVRLNQAKAYRARALQFMNIDTMEQKVFKHLGEKLLQGNDDAVAGWRKTFAEIMVDNKNNPVKKLQELTYYWKMGFWNPAQALKQSMTIVHTAGLVGPLNAAKAGVLSIAQRTAMTDWNGLKEVTKDVVRELGLNEKHYEWMTEDLRRIGFGKMGREFANRADNLEGQYIKTKFGTVLDHSTVFVKAGEEFSRRTAWNAAYMEFLTKTNNKRPNDAQLSAILDRADLLNNNMSHASNAAWNTGFTGVPTQFWSYQARLTELFTGKRLTTGEKAKLFATYGAAFGIPTAASGALGIWPIHETIREDLIKNNIDTSDSIIANTLNKGFLGMVTDGFLGEPTDLATVYGPSGIPFLKDLLDGDKNVVELIGGASGNVVSNTLMGLVPAVGWIKAAVNPNEDAVPYTASDFMEVLRPITFVTQMEKMYAAVAVQKYFSKSGGIIGDVDNVPRALLMDLIGVQPQALQDMYATFKVNKQYDDYVNKVSKDVEKSVNRMLQSDSMDDKMTHLKAAQIKSLLIPDPLRRITIFGDIVRKNKTMIERSAEEHARQSPEAREYELKKLRERLGQ